MPDIEGFSGQISMGKKNVPTKYDATLDKSLDEDFVNMIRNAIPNPDEASVISPIDDFYEIPTMSSVNSSYIASVEAYEYLEQNIHGKKKIGIFGIDTETIKDANGEDVLLTIGLNERELDPANRQKGKVFFKSKSVEEFIIKNDRSRSAMDLYRQRLGYEGGGKFKSMKIDFTEKEAAHLRSVWGLARDSKPFDFSALTNTDGTLTDEAKRVLGSAFDVFDQESNTGEDRFINAVFGKTNTKYSGMVMMGHNFYDFDKRILRSSEKINRYWSTREGAGNLKIIDSLALARNMKDPARIYRFASVRGGGGLSAPLTGHSLDAFSDAANLFIGEHHVASTDTLYELKLQNEIARSWGNPKYFDKGKRYRATGSFFSRSPIFRKSGEYSGSPIDGTYSFNNGEWSRVYRSTATVSKNRIFGVLNPQGAITNDGIFQFSHKDKTYYGRMLRNQSEGTYTLVSRDNLDEAKALLRGNFTQYGGVRMEEQALAAYEDLARNRFEGMFIGNDAAKSYSQFRQTVSAINSFSKDSAYSDLYNVLRAGVKDPTDMLLTAQKMAESTHFKGISSANIRNIIYAFPRMAAELPALNTLYEHLEDPRMKMSEFQKGQTLAMVYASAREQAAKTGKKNLFYDAPAHRGLYLYNSGTRSYTAAELSAEGIERTLTSIMKSAPKYAPEQRTALFSAMDDLYERLGKRSGGVGSFASHRQTIYDMISNAYMSKDADTLTSMLPRSIAWHLHDASMREGNGLWNLSKEEIRQVNTTGILNGRAMNARIADVRSGQRIFHEGAIAQEIENARAKVHAMGGFFIDPNAGAVAFKDAVANAPTLSEALSRSQATAKARAAWFATGVKSFEDGALDSAAIKAIQNITDQVQASGRDAVTYMLDNKRNSVQLLVYSNSVSQELMTKYKTSGEWMHDPNVLSFSIPLMDQYGNYYHGNSYKANPVMLRLNDKMKGLSAEEFARESSTLRAAIKNGLDPIGAFASRMDITDARTEMLDIMSSKGFINSILAMKQEKGASFAERHLKRTMNHRMANIMTQDYMRADSAMMRKAVGSLTINSARLDFGDAVKMLLGKQDVDYLSQSEQREAMRTLDSFMNKSGILNASTGARLAFGNKIEQIIGFTAMLHDITKFMPFGSIAQSGREEMYQWMNYLKLDDSMVKQAFMIPGLNVSRSRGLVTESEFDRIASSGELTSIGLKTAVVDENVLAKIMKENGFEPYSAREGMGMMRGDIKGLFNVNLERSMLLDEGVKLNPKLEEALRAGKPFDANGYLENGNFVIGEQFGREIRYSKPRNVTFTGMERMEDGKLKLIYNEFTDASRYSQKMGVDIQKITYDAVDPKIIAAVERALGRETGSLHAVIGSKAAKKETWNQILSGVIQDMFDSATKAKVSSDEIIRSMNAAFIGNLVDPKFRDQWGDRVFTRIVNGVGAYDNALVMNDLQGNVINNIMFDTAGNNINSFYSDFMNRVGLAGTAPIRQLTVGGVTGATAVGTSQHRIYNVENWARVYSGNLDAPNAGVTFTIRNFEALKENSIMVNGIDYGHNDRLETWLNRQFRPDGKGYSAKSARAYENEQQFLRNRLAQAEIMANGGQLPTKSASWYDQFYSTIQQKNASDLVFFEDITKLNNQSLAGTIYDVKGDGMMLKLSEGVDMGKGKVINNVFITPDINLPEASRRFIQSGFEGDTSMMPDPYIALYARIQHAERERSEGMSALSGLVGDARTKAEAEVHSTYQNKMSFALNSLMTNATNDLTGSKGRANSTILGGRLGYSASWKLGGVNTYADIGKDIMQDRYSAVGYISEASAREMYKDIGKDGLEDIITMMKSQDPNLGMMSLGTRNPVFDENAQYAMMLKIREDMPDNRIYTSQGDVMRWKGDFDDDPAYTMTPYVSDIANMKGSDGKLLPSKQRGAIIVERNRNAAQWYKDVAQSGTRDEVMASLKGMDQGQAAFNMMYMDWMSSRTQSRAANQWLQDPSNIESFLYTGSDASKSTFRTSEMRQAIIARESKAYKNIGAFSNYSSRIRRFVSHVEGLNADGEVASLLEKYGRGAMILDQLSVVGDVFKQVGASAEQGATSLFTKKLGTLVKADMGNMTEDEILATMEGTIGKIDALTDAFGTGDIQSAYGIMKEMDLDAFGDKSRFSHGFLSKYSSDMLGKDDAFYKGVMGAIEQKGVGGVIGEAMEAQQLLSRLMNRTALNSAGMNAFLTNPKDFDKAVTKLQGIFNSDTVLSGSDYLETLFESLGRSTEPLTEGKRQLLNELVASSISMDQMHTTRKIFQGGDSTVDDMARAGARAAFTMDFHAGGALTGVLAFGAAWAASGLLRGAPTDIEQPQADVAPNSDGKYVDPAVLPPGPRGTQIPTARIMSNDSVGSQLRVSVTGNIRGRNSYVADDLLYSLRAQMGGIGVPTTITLNNRDMSSVATRQSTARVFDNYMNKGYAYNDRN